MKAQTEAFSLGLIFAVALVAACGSSVPVPKEGPHAGDEPVEVPFPPPPANPEVIQKHNLGKKAVWVDGEWKWNATAWVWQPGRWETPYPDSYYAPPKGERLADGRLMWFHGAWHSTADIGKPRPVPTASPVQPPSPRSSTGVPLPTLPPGAERLPDPPLPAPTAAPSADPSAPPAAPTTSPDAPTAPTAAPTGPPAVPIAPPTNTTAPTAPPAMTPAPKTSP